MNGAFILDADRNAHLLAALLPRAVAEWEHNAISVCGSCGFRYDGVDSPPRDLESAINILEKP